MPENTSTPVPVTSVPTSAYPGGGTRLAPVPSGAPALFALHAAPRFAQCPPPPPDLAEPGRDNLAYGLTLPSAAATPTIAQEAAETILEVHLTEGELMEPVLFLVHELVAYACQFTEAGVPVQLALRRAEDVFQVTVYDTHAVHTHSRLAAACDERRRSALERVPRLVAEYCGTWGFGAAYPFSTGTCTWATLGPIPGSEVA